MASNTNDLISKIAVQYDYYVTGTAVSGGTTTLGDASHLLENDNFWNSHYCKIQSGANAGLERMVSAYSQVGGLTFATAYPSAIAPGDVYELKGVRDSDILSMIQAAVNHAGTDWMAIKVNEAMSFIVTQQIYDLPADCISLISVDVYTAQPNQGLGQWRQFTTYEVYGAPGSLHMMVRDWQVSPNIPAATYKIRLNYLALPSIPTGSSDTLGLDPALARTATDFVTEFALSKLHMLNFSRDLTGESARQHYTAAQMHATNAEKIEARRVVRYPNSRVTTSHRPRMIG